MEFIINPDQIDTLRNTLHKVYYKTAWVDLEVLRTFDNLLNDLRNAALLGLPISVTELYHSGLIYQRAYSNTQEQRACENLDQELGDVY